MGKEAKAMESVIITLKSTQQGRENEAEETELDTLGTCQRKDGVLELSYEDTEVTGFVGSTTMVRVEQSDAGMLVNIMRSGTANSNLILEIGKKHFSVYNTPYGDMTLGIETDELVFEETPEGGKIFMAYTIDMNSAFLSENTIELVWKRNEAGE